MTLFILILLGVLLLGLFFFSAAETALVSLSPQKAKSLAVRTPQLAQALQGWLINPHELLTLILVGLTFITVFFGALSSILVLRIFPHLFHTHAEIVSWFFGTFLIVIIGEMMPKFLARTYPEQTSLIVLPWLSRMRQIVAPLLNLILKPLAFLFPKWKSPPVGQVLTFSLEELKSLLEEDVRSSLSPQDDSVSMMQRILEINNRRAEKIMTPMDKVDLIEIEPLGRPPMSRDLLIDLIIENGHTRTPVKLAGEMVGFIHSDDLMASLLQNRSEDLRSFIRKGMDVPADRQVNDLLQDFSFNGLHMGFVRDPNGKVLGIVTLEDVLEEITGEILDEYDSPAAQGKVG